MKKIGVVSSLFRWRASLALIDEDFGGCGVRFARGRGYCRAPAWRLTNESHGNMIIDKSDEGQHTSLRVEMGNPNLDAWNYIIGFGGGFHSICNWHRAGGTRSNLITRRAEFHGLCPWVNEKAAI